MQSLKISSNEVITAPPQGQPATPGQQAAPGEKPSETGGKAASGAIPGQIAETDVFKAVEGTKITTLTPLSGSDPFAGQNPGASVPIGGLIDGTLAVELMDALLPSLLVALMAAIGAQMKKTDLQLTAKEKSTLAPLMQKCMDQLMINFQSPFAALGVSMLIIYGSKVTEHGIVQLIDKKTEKAQRERERKEQTATVKQTAAPVINSEQQKPAPVVNIQSAPVPPRRPNTNAGKQISTDWEPSDEQIFEAKRRIKDSHHAVVVRLKREHHAGTLETFFKKKPFKR